MTGSQFYLFTPLMNNADTVPQSLFLPFFLFSFYLLSFLFLFVCFKQFHTQPAVKESIIYIDVNMDL